MTMIFRSLSSATLDSIPLFHTRQAPFVSWRDNLVSTLLSADPSQERNHGLDVYPNIRGEGELVPVQLVLSLHRPTPLGKTTSGSQDLSFGTAVGSTETTLSEDGE